MKTLSPGFTPNLVLIIVEISDKLLDLYAVMFLIANYGVAPTGFKLKVTLANTEC